MRVSVLKYSFIFLHLFIMFEVIIFTLTDGLLWKEMSYMCATMIAGVAAYSHILHTESMSRRFSLEISNTLLGGLLIWFSLMTFLLLVKAGIVMEDSFIRKEEPFSISFSLLESFKAVFVAVLIPKVFPQESR